MYVYTYIHTYMLKPFWLKARGPVFLCSTKSYIWASRASLYATDVLCGWCVANPLPAASAGVLARGDGCSSDLLVHQPAVGSRLQV